MAKKSAFWDEMAKNYPRYNDPSIRADAKKIFTIAQNKGVVFKNKNVLDIGCATGTLALALAKEVESIDAIDISKPMLEIFENDIKLLGYVSKIQLLHSSWDEFDLNKRYDIALASMSGAVSNEKQYEKFIDATKDRGIFVGWGEYKENDVINQILQIKNISKSQNLNQAKRFANYLKQKDMTFALEFFNTSWSNSYSFDEAFIYAKSHLERIEVNVSENMIKNILTQNLKNNEVEFTTKAQKGVVVFEK